MSQTYCILLSINEENIEWAKTHYPQFWNEDLGDKKRTSFLLSRALLLQTLKTYYNISELPKISYNQHQKPCFESSNIAFNLTHSQNFIGLIISSQTTTLGIDIEAIIPRRNFLGLLQRTFTTPETQWILQSESHDQSIDIREFSQIKNHPPLNNDEMIRFFLLWSAKEAYLKADGRGLQGLNTLCLNPKRSTMSGDLNKGTLLLTTLSVADTEALNSIALYLPHSLLADLSIQTLAITSHHQAIYRPLSIKWDFQLLESDSLPS